MATSSTTSNSVSIDNLPLAQLAVNTDRLILNTQNGTQAILFRDLNVVRTDVTGNATVVGDISGSNAIFSQVRTDQLSINNVSVNQVPGNTVTYGYANKIQTTGGVVLSSGYVIGSPEYQELYALYQALSANTSQQYKKVFEYTGRAAIVNNASSSNILTINGFPFTSTGNSVGNLIGNSQVYAAYFTLTPFSQGNSIPPSNTPNLSAFQYFPGTGTGDDYIQFGVGFPYPNVTGQTVFIACRLVYFYN